METIGLLRHQIIMNFTAQHSEKVVDTAIHLWEQMATQIISIVGVEGFNSLYARSVFLTQSTFPWSSTSPLGPLGSQTALRFAELKISLQGLNFTQANEANRLLLITFTDILVSLIGEQLTCRILCSAWSNDVNEASDCKKEIKK